MEEKKSSSHFNEQLISLREKQRSSDEIKSIAMQFLKEEPDNLDAHAWFAVTQRRINDPKFLNTSDMYLTVISTINFLEALI
jgi:hypothetical protein